LSNRPDLAALIGHDHDLDDLREDSRCKLVIEAAMLMLQTAGSPSSGSAP
jgi:hypothetical protein